jgi:hypothetical protein
VRPRLAIPASHATSQSDPSIEQEPWRVAVACLMSRRAEWCGSACALPQLGYKVGLALACIIGGRRPWTVEMISSVSIPCRCVPVVGRCEWPSWRWISGSGIPSCRSSTTWAQLMARGPPPHACLQRDVVKLDPR